MANKVLKVCVADFRRAASKLKQAGEVVTFSRLAESMSVDVVYVTRVLNELPWLKVELLVRTEQDATRARFQRAICSVQQAGVTPSYSSVARALGMKERAVRVYCRRHPDVLPECGIISLAPHYAYNKIEYFRERINALVVRGMVPTPTAYADAYRVDRSSLYKVIHAHEEIAKLFKLGELYRRPAAE
jgi:hypothetical protein